MASAQPVLRIATIALVASAGLLCVPAATGLARNCSVRSTSPCFSRLAAGEIALLSKGERHRVVVLFRHRPGSPSGNRDLSTRIQSSESTLHLLHQVRAREVRTFHLIDAISARITSRTARYLRSSPLVRAVVPDRKVFLPRLPISNLRSSLVRRHLVANLRTCSGSTLLEPEALQLTNSAFSDPSIPQAQSLATGQGVTVAYIADGLDFNNPDFIRSGGQKVFTDYQDFSGEGVNSYGAGGEAFGDASSIAAQGNEIYDLNKFVASGRRATTPCPIRIMGVAPGSSLMGLDVFGRSFTYESTVVDALQYAVIHGANVVNESLGFYPVPDTNIDPLTMANDAAVSAGVTVVVASGDSGTTGTVSSPASDPNVISVGATTQFQSYEQLGLGGALLQSGGYLDNNISGLSSGGVTLAGNSTVDVVAPGDLSWALCTPQIYYADCGNYNGRLSNIELFGGTSESAPLTAGEAALVIQAYRDSHGGVLPSPLLVKQIIMSSATDLGIPSYEQGAGLINSLRAVQMAAGLANPGSASGEQLLTSGGPLTAFDLPGTTEDFPVTVTNAGADPQTVAPLVTTLGTDQCANTYTPQLLKVKSAPKFIDESGSRSKYVVRNFTVPAGMIRLDAAIAWDEVSHGGVYVQETLFDPSGNLAAFSDLQGVDTGYAHVDVRFPQPGTWKAVLSTEADSFGYTGAVKLHVSCSQTSIIGSVLPASVTVAPGDSQTFHVSVNTPAQAGDLSGQVTFDGPTSAADGSEAGAIPLVLRSLIPISGGTGSFSGVLTGGNGRGDYAQSQAFQFQAPPGESDVDVSLTMVRANYDVEGVLVNPAGTAVDIQTNLVPTGKGISLGKSIQFVRRDPEPGLWSLVILVNYFTAGHETSLPITGAVAFNAVQVVSSGIPDSSSTAINSGSPASASITVKNTGLVTERYFVDPRLNTTAVLSTKASTSLHIPDLPESFFVVPPETTSIDTLSQATFPNVPIESEMVCVNGADPSGYVYAPDIMGTSYIDGGTAAQSSAIHYSTGEVPSGYWAVLTATTGPYIGPAPFVVGTFSSTVTTQAFDTSVASSTHDVWLSLFNTLKIGTFKPLVLAPGKTGTIHVTITPSANPGTIVGGTIYLDTMLQAGGYPVTGSGDEVKAIPYTYQVG